MQYLTSGLILSNLFSFTHTRPDSEEVIHDDAPPAPGRLNDERPPRIGARRAARTRHLSESLQGSCR
ncbi:hypothetical protein HKW98_12225 [Stutzerimonas urumqiensis]|uniref:hypothetical protein n=1 Tax=Stutzerimonas urumqiensis TaxID=638269 RepID=UPI003BA93F55